MADLLKESKGYLEARLKECETRPELNGSQIAEYKKYLDMVASSKDANEYADKIAFSGDMFSISQAEQLDRYNNMIRLKNAFGDTRSADAMKLCLDAAAASTSHTDLYQKMEAATLKSTELINAAARAREQVSTLIFTIVAFHVSCASKKAAAGQKVKSAWEELKRLDPGITWESMVAYKPYRSIIMFDDGRIEALHTWFKEATA